MPRAAGAALRPALLRVGDVELAVERHYALVRLSDEFQTAVRAHLEDTLLAELGSIDGLTSSNA